MKLILLKQIKKQKAGCRWLTPDILLLMRQSSGGLRFEASLANVSRDPILKKTLHKKRAGGVAPGVDTEFKPQYHTHKESDITVT
jgi:hypothetical protein